MGWTESTIDQLYKAIGRRIRDARQQADITQTSLAKRLGKTRSSVANFEAGRQRITVHGLMQVAEELNVPVQSLLAEPAHALEQAAGGSLPKELDGQPDTTADFVASALRRAE